MYDSRGGEFVSDVATAADGVSGEEIDEETTLMTDLGREVQIS